MKQSALDRSNRRLQKSALDVRSAGRGGDSILMHVNPKEAAHMERAFGPASKNPHTGLPEHGFFSKLKKAVGFELWHGKKILKGFRASNIFGVDPIGTKIGNAVLGRKDKPLVDQLGGARPDRLEQYQDETGKDSGYAGDLQGVAHMIAGAYGGNAVGGLAGQGAGALGASEGVAGAVGAAAGKGATMAANKISADSAQPTASSLSKKKATSLLLGRAGEIANRPYTEYEGDRVAGLTNNELKASELARQGNPDARRLLDKSESAIDDSTQEFNKDNLERYLSPYRDSGIANENEEFDRQNASLLNSKAGAFGGDRAAFATSELNRQHMGALSDINAKAYDQATNAFFNDAQRMQNAATAYENVAGDVSQLNRQQIQDLMATGGLERVLNQADLDFDYQQFTENRDWDITNLEPLLRALGTTGQPGANPKGDNTAAALGAAATIAGAYFSSGTGSTTSAPPAAGSYQSQAVAAGVS